MRGALAFYSSVRGISSGLRAIAKGSVAMTPLKASQKSGFLTVKHLDIRLQKIRSLKTRMRKPLKIVQPAVRARQAKPSFKSIVPYGLVVASLVLSGVTAS